MSTREGALAGRRIVLGVTGSIAAYKSPFLLRHLQAAGAEVRVILTEAAGQFIGKAVFSGLGAKCYDNMWKEAGEAHVELGKWAEALVVAPATADFLSRLRAGRCADLLTATALCTTAPLFVAPAMHPAMWSNPATADNVTQLGARGVKMLGPVAGIVASGDDGVGRMAEPEVLFQQLARHFQTRFGSLREKRLVVSAGPTRELLDPVRALTNLSTGKMGYAVAAAAASRGAEVTLISGPVSLSAPNNVRMVHVETTVDLGNALDEALGPQLDQADALVMAAAVSDYRPAEPSSEKRKRKPGEVQLTLTPNPDLLAQIGHARSQPGPLLVGFCLETKRGDALRDAARKKLVEKQVDMIVANHADDSLGREDNQVLLVTAHDCQALPPLPKSEVAARILDFLETKM